MTNLTRKPVQFEKDNSIPPLAEELQQLLLQRCRNLAQSGDRQNAIQSFITVFRHGSPVLKKKAIDELQKMGEVGTF